jgi:hypothetical protein
MYMSNLALEFNPVTEFDAASLPALLANIGDRRRSRADSYGAYLIHGASQADVDICIDEMRGMHPVGYELKEARLPYAPGLDKEIHDDDINGRANGVTTHITRQGEAEAIILSGSRLRLALLPRHWRAREQASQELFDEHTLDTRVATAPKKALRVSLGPDDLLLFDHTQPHLFRSITADRQSIGYYFKIPNLR